jgi:peptide/nickel transport system permease protein
VLRRAAVAGAVVWGAATVAFGALQLVPGDPVSVLLGPSNTASPAVRAEITREYGFDRPVWDQYLRYLGQLVHGDLGQSYQLRRPVSALIGGQLQPTAQLALSALLIAVVVALVSAVTTCGRPWPRRVASAAELVAVSSPSYWTGIVLLTVFSFHLHVFPVASAQSLSALVLPAITLGLPVAGTLAQVLREGLEAALAEPFAVTVRARGLSRTALVVRHALRHAAIPLVALTGWLTGALLGGTVLVETVFGRPGIGSLALQAVNSRDMPVVMGVVLLSALVFLAISTVVDLLYSVLDPRLRKR